MLIIVPPPFRKRRRRARRAQVVPPPVLGPVLMAASYDSAALTVLLSFDRVINISGLDGLQIEVNDGVVNLKIYRATGSVVLVDPQSVRLGLVYAAVASPGTWLSANNGNGIRDANGDVWAGVFQLPLPYP